MTAPQQRWENCYDGQWKGLIVPEAFKHPAKFSRNLIERIFDYCMQRGYLQRGDRVGDCFGGIGTGGIIAAYRGLEWTGVELEPEFVKLANQNFDLHRDKWRRLGVPIPRIIRGDSRQFARLVAEASAIVASPPFSTPNMQPRIGQGHRKDLPNGESRAGHAGDRTEGNIETLPPGSVAAVITSPPYENSIECKSGIDPAKVKKPGGPNCNTHHANYGNTKGQIGRESSETYWSAMLQVYRQCYLALKPGGVLVLVLKDYVKNKKRVLLCDDSVRLLEHIGFELIERIHAMLVSESVEDGLFGDTYVTKKERKSFFRRLAEKKGSPEINYEEVIILRRP